ncbi:MAG: sulfatase [Candidatus Sumerlaeota bacterium]
MNQQEKPNVLFIAVDDLRPFLGCYGDSNAYTPNIDGLAKKGVLFSNAMCTAPSCGPSRAALMSGQYPTNTGIYGFQDWAGREDFEDVVTLPEYFRQSGYKTFASGKIHHNSRRVHSYTTAAVEKNKASSDPEPTVMIPRADREWDVNNVGRIHQARYNHDPVYADSIDWSGGSKEGPSNNDKLVSGPSDDDVMDCMDGVTSDFGIDVLRQKHEQPFFLATGFVRPHLPFIAPRKYFEHYPLDSIELHPVKEDDLADAPWVARRNARVDDDINIRQAAPDGRKRVIQAYYACASFVDDMIGRVLSELERSPHADNTIVAFWSDHGWHLGEKRSWRKFSLWEESARTPMIIYDPRRKHAAGKKCERPVGLIDLYPTLAELCGLDVPEHLDGASLRALLDNPEADTPDLREPELTVQGRGNYSLRDETWRYTRYFDGGEELFNHREDPYEWKNLAGDPQFREVKEMFSKRLPEEAVKTFEPRGLSCWADLDKDDMEQFRNDVWPKWLEKATPSIM